MQLLVSAHQDSTSLSHCTLVAKTFPLHDLEYHEEQVKAQRSSSHRDVRARVADNTLPESGSKMPRFSQRRCELFFGCPKRRGEGGLFVRIGQHEQDAISHCAAVQSRTNAPTSG